MADTLSKRILAAVDAAKAVPSESDRPKPTIPAGRFPKRLFAVVVALLAVKAVFFPTFIDYRAPILQATRNVTWCRQQTTQFQSMSYCANQEKELEDLWRKDEEQRVLAKKCLFCMSRTAP